MSSRISDFFRFCRERHTIHLRRLEGTAPPWTDDAILRRFRFCNVYRELDRTTIWFRENLREPLRNQPIEVLRATIAFRWFNRIRTGQALLHAGLREGHCNPSVARDAVLSALPEGPWVTGAFMVKTPPGLSKLDGVLWCIANATPTWLGLAASLIQARSTLSGAHSLLQELPYMGSFMAYEVVTDLRHTCLLGHAIDVNAWAAPGPGAVRGMDYVAGHAENFRRYTSALDREDVLKDMRRLLELSRVPLYWSPQWPAWEMREVEHSLCEFWKYERCRLTGQHPKQLFKPTETTT